MANARLAVASGAPAIEVNSVLRQTYLLLAATILFSGAAASIAIYLRLPYMGFVPYIIGLFGLSWIVNYTANSVWGLFWTFVFAGFLGVAMAPIVGYHLATHPIIVVQSLAVTAVTFVGLSMYTIVKRTDFSWLGQFLTVAFLVVLGVIVLSFFVDLSPFAVVIMGFMVFIACALILFRTSQIVLGGETNYIRATVDLFLSIYILFINLMSLLSIFGGDD